jgi:DNA-binding CsgD family transcriptional regulator
MALEKALDYMKDKSPEKLKEIMLMRFSAMTPEEYNEHLRNEHTRAVELGREKEREEIVCRLLASGMDTEEIAAILGTKVHLIQTIQDNNKSVLIPKYEKKLQARRRRK